jgi:hypothetical protein
MKKERGSNEMKDKFLILHRSSFLLYRLLCLFVSRVFATTSAELLKLKALGCRLLIFRRYIVTAFAIRTLKHNIIARHSFFLENCKIVCGPLPAVHRF